MEHKRIEYLHQRYLDGNLSREEMTEWDRLLHTDEHEATLRAMMFRTWSSITPHNQQSLAPLRAEQVFKQVMTAARPRQLWRWLSAAAILLAASVAWWLVPRQESAAPRITTEHIAPGGNRATLSLADGTTINLSTTHEGVIIGDDIIYNDGTAVRGSRSAPAYPAAEPMTISTPHGGTYRVTLSDGTIVWLNAASTLTYPSRFSGNERRVELTGEAYFSVARDANNPFVVYSRDQRVQVVGTEFNVHAYADEASTATTLVTGRVNVGASTDPVSNPDGVYRLSPGQQSIVEQGTFRIQKVDIDQHTAWRDGRFNFDGKTLPEVMRELGRWYGVKVAYEGTLPELEFYGGARRNDNLALVLALLETNGINYRLTPDTTLVLSAASPVP